MEQEKNQPLITGAALAERAIALRLACASAHELCQRLINEGADEEEAGKAARFYDPQRKRTPPDSFLAIDIYRVHPLAFASVAIVAQILEIGDAPALRGPFGTQHLNAIQRFDSDYSWPAIRAASMRLLSLSPAGEK